MSLGNLVATQRKRLRYSQEELAKMAGVSREQVSKIENNRAQHPSWGDLNNIARALALPADEVLSAAGYSVSSAPAEPTKSMVSILRQALAIAEEMERKGLGLDDYEYRRTQKKTTATIQAFSYQFVR